MTNKHFLGAAALAATLVFSSSALFATASATPAPPANKTPAKEDAAKPAPLSEQDQKFINDAWNINSTEILLGTDAQQKAANADVKAFAKTMVTDHTKLNQELTSLAGEHGAALPKDLTKDNQQLIDRLSRLSGTDFDKQYMSAMISGHEQAVTAFEERAKEKAQTPVDKWASQALPTLQQLF